jgi:hypothetical protein
MEGSHSGRVRTLGKRICPKGYQGFESPSLRLRSPKRATADNVRLVACEGEVHCVLVCLFIKM